MSSAPFSVSSLCSCVVLGHQLLSSSSGSMTASAKLGRSSSMGLSGGGRREAHEHEGGHDASHGANNSHAAPEPAEKHADLGRYRKGEVVVKEGAQGAQVDASSARPATTSWTMERMRAAKPGSPPSPEAGAGIEPRFCAGEHLCVSRAGLLVVYGIRELVGDARWQFAPPADELRDRFLLDGSSRGPDVL